MKRREMDFENWMYALLFQFSRHRSYLQLQREMDVDEFDIEVKNFERFQQSKRVRPRQSI